MNRVETRPLRKNPSWAARFWAVVEYELLSNIRKKKFLGVVLVVFALTTLSLALPVFLHSITKQALTQNPDYVVGSGVGLGGLGFFLFALVTGMDSVSGEFESGTIVTLLTKPVSRTMVFLGKLFTAFINILSAYTVLSIYMAIGGTIIYGPQNNLYLMPISLLADTLSTFVWVSIIMAMGSVSKSSMIASLTGFSIFLGLFIGTPIVSMFSGQTWILNYLPGSGTSGYIIGLKPLTSFTNGMSIYTGTDYISTNLINYILYPSSHVTFYQMGIPTTVPLSMLELYIYVLNAMLFQNYSLVRGVDHLELLSNVVFRSVFVALIYVIVFSFIAWYALRRAQIHE